MKEDFREMLDRAMPTAAEQDDDYWQLKRRLGRPAPPVWLGAGLLVAAVALFIVTRPSYPPTDNTPRGRIEFRAADIPGAQTITIDFTYPEASP